MDLSLSSWWLELQTSNSQTKTGLLLWGNHILSISHASDKRTPISHVPDKRTPISHAPELVQASRALHIQQTNVGDTVNLLLSLWRENTSTGARYLLSSLEPCMEKHCTSRHENCSSEGLFLHVPTLSRPANKQENVRQVREATLPRHGASAGLLLIKSSQNLHFSSWNFQNINQPIWWTILHNIFSWCSFAKRRSSFARVHQKYFAKLSLLLHWFLWKPWNFFNFSNMSI